MMRLLGDLMREGERAPVRRLECVMVLTGDTMVATIYEPNRWGVAYLCLNRWLLRSRKTGPVLSWAQRQLASGKRVAWLLANELDALA